MLDVLKPYLGDVEALVQESQTKDKSYIHPKLRNLGSVSIVAVREIIAPTVFRNSDPETTDIDVLVGPDGTPVRAIRAVPNKWKHRERGRGLQILRHFGVGGSQPQNRYVVSDSVPYSEVFDLNSLVFGDSINRGKAVLPVKSACLYSDGISLSIYEASVGKTFHNRASEDGTLYDYAKGQNSDNIFDRHYILPGTLMVQVISTHGRMLPPEGLDHLLLSMGLANSYGGQTSVSGINVRTHLAGIYASKSERPESSPYVLAAEFLKDEMSKPTVDAAVERLSSILGPVHEVSVERTEVESYRDDLINCLNNNDPELRLQYQKAAAQIGEMFGAWFSNGEVKDKLKAGRSSKAA